MQRGYSSFAIGPRLLNYVEMASKNHKRAIEEIASPSISQDKREELRSIISECEDLHSVWSIWSQTKKNIDEIEDALKNEADPELVSMMHNEATEYRSKLEEIGLEMRSILVRPDEDDLSSAILEVRPAAGGEEASIFAAELFEMYQQFSTKNSWHFDLITKSQDGPNSLREGIAKIEGSSVFGRLKWESGVHRVQRVPITESQGRIHTSTVTVAIMPQSKSHHVEIPEKDIRLDVFRSSGAGGQNANKTNSAVRLVHIPTGLMVCIEEERDQQKNRARAMTILKARLQERKRRELDAQRQKTRQSQIGSGERSEKIRTYNFPQDRITDHRLGTSVFGVADFLKTSRGLEQFIERLKLKEEGEKLDYYSTINKE